MKSLVLGWADSLDPRLQRYYLANLLGLFSALVALTIAYAVGLRSPMVEADIGVMSVALIIILVGIPLARNRGATAAVWAMVASSAVFGLGAVWSSPFLAPIAVTAQFVPLTAALAHVGPRVIRAVLVITLLVGSATVAVAELRRPDAELIAPIAAAISSAVALPFIIAVLAMAIRENNRRLAEQADALRESRSQIVSVADATRRGLERDLHDGAQNRLVLMSVELGRLRSLLAEGRTSEAAEVVAAVVRHNHDALQELRELAQGIYPPLLAERGLPPALRAAARRCAISCTVDADDIPRYDEAVEAAVYFCILEALQNAVKHSGAPEVRVHLSAERQLRFEVIDDGAGFDVHVRQASGGLLGMQARLAAAGGRLEVVSVQGRGTTVRGTFG
ncbi:sensor histidine kinase [Nocardioides sp.]|uniref:sensor histidine kinase n=1 Tax=Nocardioides sp. TaxID=35761 RepID=UPI002B678844|nr:ATP-binding protein [Nocardioides sp.]HXH80887.1 ATP-binding protein [Nocardioides sp.]